MPPRVEARTGDVCRHCDPVSPVDPATGWPLLANPLNHPPAVVVLHYEATDISTWACYRCACFLAGEENVDTALALASREGADGVSVG